MCVVVDKISDLKTMLQGFRSEGKSIGFVPTMGALHKGHVSLVERSVAENDITVVSIFVNPTQFNDKNDLKNYPRMPEKDIAMLEAAGVNVVFMPTESEIYPEPDTRVFDFGMLDKVMEGKFRPGHFNGVAQVVSKLFDIVEPHRAYFGQKDYQQLAIIRAMVRMLGYRIEIVGCPIVREPDGLAMSSRNLLLTPEHRKSAPLIYQTLAEARNKTNEFSVKDMIDWVVNRINSDPNLKVEYFELADADSLLPVQGWDHPNGIVGCIAVWAGNIRLIDNMMFK
ncbi:MAG: pantoate--beta-alanine ligase [Tenuifilum sp.]|uniref:pantoate--beta-alanine ligase n=3 Tax=Tenuifilum sp. TaxID=2760880 RepID=UPI001B70987A|nr:pantoate--beta-alanine ligase [Bacteroidales bacterium]HOK60199.1 pantoate--beta-alanine ligase [Tenuifilum sp.]MBP9028925.1 pantoate--beta-alanine ligase [Bacteroidales bacterium]HOK85079.1 pantoate--beta-alanine ligase [Tenuifilum sp.]HON70124.1 pantoate--beta-alanine ligase [Tenuifilum sp.]